MRILFSVVILLILFGFVFLCLGLKKEEVQENKVYQEPIPLGYDFKVYQGPVPEGFDLQHFRETGETIREVING